MPCSCNNDGYITLFELYTKTIFPRNRHWDGEGRAPNRAEVGRIFCVSDDDQDKRSLMIEKKLKCRGL